MPNFINDSKNINQYTPIELYKFDFSTIAPRFFGAVATDVKISNHRQSDGSDIVMNGTTFEHCAVVIENVKSELDKAPTNPILTIDRTTFEGLTNVAALITSWTNLGNLPPFPFRGATVERMITLHEYKNDSDWGMTVDGAISSDDVLLSGVKSRYFVSSIDDYNEKYIRLSLTSALGFVETSETNRNLPTGLCSLRYRNYLNGTFEYTSIPDGGCPYGQQLNGDSNYNPNTYYDINNNLTTDPAKDYCNKTIRACRLRWASGSTDSPLPFTGNFKIGTPGTEHNE